MDMSESFDEEAFSDVILHLETGAAQPSGIGEKRPTEDAPSRSFLMHRVVLLTSPYFKALMLRWNEPHAGRMKLTEHVEKGDLEAAEMVLLCLYKTGELPQQAHGRVELLLKMHRLADKYELPSRCMESILGGLSALTREQVDVDLLSAVYALPPALLGSEALEPLLATCQLAVEDLFGGDDADEPLSSDLGEAVVRIFRDVPAIITCEELKSAFFCLRYEAVRTWIKASMFLRISQLISM